ncbi:MAG: hypothetical protein U0441_23170 [Polyangiaceae bacterium]
MKKASVIRFPEKAPRGRSAKQLQAQGPESATRSASATIGEGLVPGRIVQLESEAVTVELLGGGAVQATVADEMEPGFVAECLRVRRTVLVTQTPSGVVLLGALQTGAQVAASGDESAVRARRFVVDATEGIVLRVGQTEVSLDPAGLVRVAGEKMSVAVARVFRVLSASAELP